ncbi:tyrosine-type recombinase/integrase [Crassaminicella profunda]|uniref:tyrosine-type recombinase/integrase n=1 Tax=Crassaminicella profunda TaxID=1286698 RepID=UPI001CA69EDE|nr:site-specific integrase [Crassaminicella profunda]QZY56670.1 site-specific integrase [Crassaminicella profunda]
MKNKLEKSENKSCLNRYIEYIKTKFPKTSVETRKAAIRQFLLYLEEKSKVISQAHYADVDDFIEREYSEDTAQATLNNYFSYLKGFFQFCKLHKDNDTIEFDKIQYKRGKSSNFIVYSEKEIKEIFQIINEKNRESLKLRDRVMYSLLFYTGCTLKELHSINIYRTIKDFYDDDFYIILDKKVIGFRNPNLREIPLPNKIIENIIMYIQFLEEKYHTTLPNGCYLFATYYGGNLKRIKYSSLQRRMNDIKKISSFNNKKLSIKNTRHTLIKKYIENEERVDLISEAFDIDITSLKVYFEKDLKREEEINNMLLKRHPLKHIVDFM